MFGLLTSCGPKWHTHYCEKIYRQIRRRLMLKSQDNLDVDDSRFNPLALRVQLGIKRKQVALGRERLLPLCRRNGVALVWASEKLSNHALGKLKLECRKYKVPILLFCSPEYIGQTTGEPSVKVYVIKRSFSGINQVLREYREFIHD